MRILSLISKSSNVVGKTLLKGYPLKHQCTQRRLTSTISITFFDEASDSKTVLNVPIGKTVLDVALEHKMNIEGACGGELACSTCHVKVSPEHFKSLPDREEEEEDMLDLAVGVSEYSRLGCQIKLTKELDGAVFTIPKESVNLL